MMQTCFVVNFTYSVHCQYCDTLQPSRDSDQVKPVQIDIAIFTVTFFILRTFAS